MAKKFADLVAPHWADPERRARIEQLIEDAEAEDLAYQLGEVRKQLGVTQDQLAERLGITQGAVSHMEHAADPKLSTLRRHVAALGGTLHIEIKLPNHDTTVDA